MNGLFIGLSLGVFTDSGGAPPATLQPPSNFSYSYSDTGTGIEITLTWQTPITGPAPDSFNLSFSSLNTGGSNYNLSGSTFSQTITAGYSDLWSAQIFSLKSGFDDSAFVSLSGETPPSP